MKSISARIAAAMLLATALAGCASEDTTSSDTFGSVAFNLIVGSTDVTSVAFEVTCNGLTLNGEFNVNDDQDPPVWATIMDLPVGDCTVTITAKDAAGATLCSASKDVTVVENQTIKVDLVLVCEIGGGDDPVGNLDIDATFEIIEGNTCPRLYFLNVVPDEVPTNEGGSVVTVLAEDPDGGPGPFTSVLSATSGSFGDPNALSTTYTCDAGGSQTVRVDVSDEDPACDKFKTFDVICPGVDPCEGVVCDDTCNQCTVGICTNQSAPECEETNVANGTPCIAGIPGWVTEFCTPPDFSGPCEKTDTMANTGTSSARIFNDIPATPSVLKQANKGIGLVQPGDNVTVSFWAKGTGVNGGVAFAEFFTELEGGGTSNSIILGGAPLSLLPDQFQFFSFTVPVGDPAGGGVTVQFNAATGAVEGSTSKLFVDDVSITLESGVDVADNGSVEEGTVNSTCQEGVCEPGPECAVDTDCPATGNECIDAVCNAGTCETSNNTNACDDDTGTCNEGVCVPNAECAVDGDCPATGNECIDAVCNAGTCETSNNTNACDDDTGTCSAGQCVPDALALYAQDFEPPMDPADPDALIFDTAAEVPLGPWLFFGAVFDGTTVPDPTFKFGFGPFGAPNATADTNPNDGETFISAVVTGEGDGPQGLQQLSSFSDYNCCTRDVITGELQEGHGNGTDLVEINLFQELNPIPASFIGQTLTFSFDAKRGNIEGATTAVGFIKTLDPGAGFAITNFPTVDMTSIPDTWNRYSVTLDLTAPELEGQVLQIGFQNIAGNFEGSGIFYDNPLATLSPTP